ncbi:nucleotide exchange factor GrpE [Jeongeupia naejangsanensis]|uniref:Protein GrpE n=1 Tax=Jeongeupia naejangsanensis TaxID=613195 RepID=A0ABS2BM00_9NEIS|nr:nucleotide exchange factor GrpE [Jeongeupia naejangsanensis]MBM3116641.1 nucleotide exchange factor GrpE [Jeongeupia naejangsanensis]
MSQENEKQPLNPTETEQDAAVAQNDVQGSDMEAQLSAALADLDRARQDVLYAKAEMDNVRRRAAEENDKARKFAVEKFARELLSVKDAMEMALLDQSGNFEALKTGVDLTHKALVSAFEKFELVEVAPVAGDKLDPNLHQAISMEPAKQEPNSIVRVLQKGYTLSGRVLRPAMVIVAAA